MGAGASAAADDAPSANDVSKWSKEEVGAQVAAIGKAFEPYKEVAIDNGIDGKTLLSLDDDDLEECVSSKMHRKMIRKRMDEIQSQQAAMPSDTAADASTGAAATTIKSKVRPAAERGACRRRVQDQ